MRKEVMAAAMWKEAAVAVACTVIRPPGFLPNDRQMKMRKEAATVAAKSMVVRPLSVFA
jgi:hypothetical protein